MARAGGCAASCGAASALLRSSACCSRARAVTQSVFGRERVRQIAERVAARYLLGSLHVGRCASAPAAPGIDSASLRDPDDSLLVASGRRVRPAVRGARARTARRHLARSGAPQRGRATVRVRRVEMVARDPPDTSPPKPPQPRRAATGDRGGPLRLSGGALLLEVPWNPPDSLRGSARDRAIASALATRRRFIRRSGNSLGCRLKTAGSRSMLRSFDVGRRDDGDCRAERARRCVCRSGHHGAPDCGRFASWDRPRVDLPSVVFNATSTRVDGRLGLGGDGATRRPGSDRRRYDRIR